MSAHSRSLFQIACFQFDESQDDFGVALTGPPHGPHAVDRRRLDLDEALALIDCMGHRAAPLGNGEAMASSAQRHDHIRWNTMLRLFAGISVITGAENPTDCAIAKAPVECLVARGGCESCAFVWAIEVER
jgi:hypothetical protein